MNTIVKTQYGEVRGSFAEGVYSFKGIPYAAPPFGANRLLPPQPVAPWSGTRDALAYGPKTPQPVYPPQLKAILAELAVSGEDCLNLNVWSSDLGSARQPVMVWIPGSAFKAGTAASPWYDGSHFARDGVVCVTINYRVGAEGFLLLDEGNANRALLDQIAALKWVQENIAAFGGDPGNVTVFGESAGAMCIGSLLSMPRTKGLFHRAILESGAAHPVMSAVTAQRVAETLAGRLGVPATRETIAALPVDRLLAAQEQLEADLYAKPDVERWGVEVAAGGPWQPVVEGNILPTRPIDRIAAGASADVDVLVGWNSDEWRLFLAIGGAINHIPDVALVGAAASYGLPVGAALAAYRATYPGASSGDLLAALQSDWWVRIPVLRLAEARTKYPSATYLYEFAWRTPQFDGQLGACHALEIPFVFDTLGNGTELLWGTDPPQKLADTMHAAWLAFATRGDPGWPKYDLKRRATMRFDTTSEVVEASRSEVHGLWEGLR